MFYQDSLTRVAKILELSKPPLCFPFLFHTCGCLGNAPRKFYDGGRESKRHPELVFPAVVPNF